MRTRFKTVSWGETMQKTRNWLWVLLLAVPACGIAYGQDQPASDTPPADASGPADGSIPYEAPATDSSAPAADASAAPAETPADAAPADQTAASETPAEAPVETPPEPGTPWHLYGGADWVRDTLSASTLAGYAPSNYDSGMYRVRGGVRLFDSIGAEGQVGFDNSDSGVNATKTKSYYGVFVVPTASVFETVELAFPVGYALTKVEHPGGSASLNSIGYGINAALPLRVFSASLPDIRFETGWMVYYQKVNARVYGLNAGLRYDFDIGGGSSSPSADTGPGFFSKVGGFFKDLWPFGGDDEAPK
jgi:hypothetical protein